MSEVTYKIRVNRPCRLFIDDEEVMILEESKLTKINLPEGEYLRKVVALDNSAIFDEVVIVLSGATKMDLITLITNNLYDDAKRKALPNEMFKVDDLYFRASEDGLSVKVTRNEDDKYIFENINIPEQVVYRGYTYPVTSIGNSAFYECYSLTSITIPSSVTSIGDWAFNGCSGLKSMVVECGNTVYDSRENCNAVIETATNTLIAGCQNTIIPNSVTSIGTWAFLGCSSLTSITIPNSVTSIGEWAFNGCSLTSITIPNSVTSIGNEAFRGCFRLTSITIPNSVTGIGGLAFDHCSSLTSITIPNSVTSIGNYAFDGCKSLIVLNYAGTKEEWKKIEKDKFWNKYSNIRVIRCTDGEIRL